MHLSFFCHVTLHVVCVYAARRSSYHRAAPRTFLYWRARRCPARIAIIATARWVVALYSYCFCGLFAWPTVRALQPRSPCLIALQASSFRNAGPLVPRPAQTYRVRASDPAHCSA